MQQDRLLSLDSFNVVIVGGGAIGSALLSNLLSYSNLNRVIVLSRRHHEASSDERVSYLRFDAEDPPSIAAAVDQVAEWLDSIHLLVNTVGLLHDDSNRPEKRLKDVESSYLEKSLRVNAILLTLLAQAFTDLLRHDEPAVLASLSARVGSIEDNQMGGWYSYRASKAAHNMLLKTIAREWRLSHPRVRVVAVHPGTVDSPLSKPFLSSTYKKTVLMPAQSAALILEVIDSLHPEDSGSFYDWQGQRIPW